MIKKRIYKHNFITGGIKKGLSIFMDLDDTLIMPVTNFDYATLYPQTQRVHHVIPDTHTTDYNVVLGEPGVGRSTLMNNLTEYLRELRDEHGWTIHFEGEPNNPIDGYNTNPCGEIPLDYEIP